MFTTLHNTLKMKTEQKNAVFIRAKERNLNAFQKTIQKTTPCLFWCVITLFVFNYQKRQK